MTTKFASVFTLILVLLPLSTWSQVEKEEALSAVETVDLTEGAETPRLTDGQASVDAVGAEAEGNQTLAPEPLQPAASHISADVAIEATSNLTDSADSHQIAASILFPTAVNATNLTETKDVYQPAASHISDNNNEDIDDNDPDHDDEENSPDPENFEDVVNEGPKNTSKVDKKAAIKDGTRQKTEKTEQVKSVKKVSGEIKEFGSSEGGRVSSRAFLSGLLVWFSAALIVLQSH